MAYHCSGLSFGRDDKTRGVTITHTQERGDFVATVPFEKWSAAIRSVMGNADGLVFVCFCGKSLVTQGNAERQPEAAVLTLEDAVRSHFIEAHGLADDRAPSGEQE